jgi:hypothetical protein
MLRAGGSFIMQQKAYLQAGVAKQVRLNLQNYLVFRDNFVARVLLKAAGVASRNAKRKRRNGARRAA